MNLVYKLHINPRRVILCYKVVISISWCSMIIATSHKSVVQAYVQLLRFESGAKQVQTTKKWHRAWLTDPLCFSDVDTCLVLQRHSLFKHCSYMSISGLSPKHTWPSFLTTLIASTPDSYNICPCLERLLFWMIVNVTGNVFVTWSWLSTLTVTTLRMKLLYSLQLLNSTRENKFCCSSVLWA